MLYNNKCSFQTKAMKFISNTSNNRRKERGREVEKRRKGEKEEREEKGRVEKEKEGMEEGWKKRKRKKVFRK